MLDYLMYKYLVVSSIMYIKKKNKKKQSLRTANTNVHITKISPFP